MIEKTPHFLAVLVVGAGILAGCGSGGGGTGAMGGVTSLDSTKPLNTLTVAETTRLCNDSLAYVGKGLSKANKCKYEALLLTFVSHPTSDAEAQTMCTSTYNSCLASAGDTTQPCGRIPVTCTATVALYSACMIDTVAELNQSLPFGPDCSAITLADLSERV